MSENKKVAVIMGSDSDFEVMKNCIKTLEKFGVEYTVDIISAHRTPRLAEEFARNAVNNGYAVIIAAAGKAAHLAGVLASLTVLPVIGVPMKSSTLDGLDSLLSTVQMPSGVPVATVAVDGAQNAAILAVQMLALSDKKLSEKLAEHKIQLEKSIAEKNIKIKEQIGNIQ